MRKTGSFRLNAHRTVQTRPVWSRSVHDGIFPDVYFYTQPLGRPHERRPMASRREQVSALFFVAWIQHPLTDRFPWATEGANPLKETLTFKKRIFWQPAPGSLPAGLNTYSVYACKNLWSRIKSHWLTYFTDSDNTLFIDTQFRFVQLSNFPETTFFSFCT